ncbi:MAG: Rieske (2Fe-2S) protein [Alphaproteobacteria bacterium]|nr:MAG: Rieske (2Fe-2S) protein [Alphaproteobacteria bacterium]
MSNRLDRRLFLRGCGKVALAAAGMHAALGPRLALADLMEDAPDVLLVDGAGAPLRAATLKPHQTLVFNYPYKSTPAMLIVLGGPTRRDVLTEDGEHHSYLWPGGVGPRRNIVAYAGICAHALSYVGREFSFLHYAAEENEFGVAGAITCCAHGSSYDPADGGRVLKGPAEFPLATIRLRHDRNTDTLTATGVIGTELYRQFFDAYRKELRDEYGRRGYRELVAETTPAVPIEEYSAEVIDC